MRSYGRYLKLERNFTHNTLDAYLRDVEKLLEYAEAEGLEVKEITTQHLQHFAATLHEVGIAARSQARILSGVRSFFRFLRMDGRIESDPTELLESPLVGQHLPEVLSTEEVDQLEAAIDLTKWEGHRNRAIVEVLFSCGLRVSELTGVPCYVAYYRRYLPYFQRVKKIITDGVIGKVTNVQIRFSVPPREFDDASRKNLPWRLQPEIAGGGYFYDLAPHQLDLMQDIFGVITEASGISTNRGGFYAAEDSVSACFQFENGVPGSGSWCFVGHHSAEEDCIEVVGTEGMLSFSVFNYDPILLVTSEGTRSITVPNPPYVQLPIIRSVIRDLQGLDICTATSVSATPVNWVLDRILGKF